MSQFTTVTFIYHFGCTLSDCLWTHLTTALMLVKLNKPGNSKDKITLQKTYKV